MSSPPSTVLVTGSSGHLGYALMLSLSSYGHTPLGIDILPSTIPNTITGTITDRELIRDIFKLHPTIQHIIHTATLHKPHVGTHSKQAFVETNISGTLVLLEEASSHGVKSFVFLSTTSTFGSVLSPRPGQPAAWIDESIVPIPKNIYGVTKVAAEDLCRLVSLQTGMPVVVLRTSRFFPEGDDDDDRRGAMADDNLKVCELAYRRVDIADVVDACVCALRKAAAGEVAWGKYIISAPTPLLRNDDVLGVLNGGGGGGQAAVDIGGLMERAVPGCVEVFAGKGWEFLERVDRIYDSSRAVRDLGWKPTYTFQNVVESLKVGREWRSELTLKVGKRGYHDTPTGVYTL